MSAAVPTDRTEPPPGSGSPAGRNRAYGPGETCGQARAAPPPGDGEEEPGENLRCPGVTEGDKETTVPPSTEGSARRDRTVCEPAEGPGPDGPSAPSGTGPPPPPPLREQREEEEEESVSSDPPAHRTAKTGEKPTEPPGTGTGRRASLELSSSDGEPLSRMDSEDSVSSTLVDAESGASSGRSTPAMMNGGGGMGGGGAGPAGGGAGGGTVGAQGPGGGKPLPGYTCCWDHCLLQTPSSPDLAEHIRSTHVDGQRGGVFVCLWKGCKVYNTPSTSHSWLQRHMLTHSGDKPFKCVVGGCNATFASQGGLARHVPTHFSSQGQGRLKEESPSKAGLNRRRRLKNKRRRSLPRPHDFFDAQTMDAIRHRAICLNLATHIESLGSGHSAVFHSTVIARRKEESGKVKVLLHWLPEDILPDAWVNESDRQQQKTKVVHLSKLPTDASLLLDPNIYSPRDWLTLARAASGGVEVGPAETSGHGVALSPSGSLVPGGVTYHPVLTSGSPTKDGDEPGAVQTLLQRGGGGDVHHTQRLVSCVFTLAQVKNTASL
ncbi:hypothetical protein NHX12_020461 [Muraenolepis orangiensis]|uniref:C2H2-type domain-containing protein n=1 Tax=Muraenolepis orangiensis TaxID=630683 RepID=A0A9Q0EUY0_9TELE|nr:hypothetical protein NHX12_020461 [Muraenolepis orangiensis]